MDWLWTILLLFLCCGLSLYWYIRNSKSYLEDLGIPYIHFNIFSVLSALLKSKIGFKFNLHDLQIETYKKYGRIYGTTENYFPVISIADPDLLRKILVKDFHVFTGRRTFDINDPIAENFLTIVNGEKWKRIRTIITPAFSTGKIKRITGIVINSAKSLAQNFASKIGEPIDGKTFFNTFTMDVIASTAFGTKIYSYQDPNNRFVQEASKFFTGKLSWRLMLAAINPKLAAAFGINLFEPNMINFFRDETLKIIEDRKKNGTVKNDFLQLLMDAENEHEREEAAKLKDEDTFADELGHEEDNAKFFKSSKKYKSLSQNELLAQCLVFFLAGFDTTATTLTCVFHVLAVYPDIQEKLRQEVDEAILRHNNQLTYESLQEMKYLDCVLSETLRMYPPSFRIERLADADYKLEGEGIDITIKKRTVVSVPIAAIHRDPEFYPEPDLFKPERFTLEEKSLRHSYSYLTFGAGPRNFVGMRFALMEIKICIAYLISQFIVKKCAKTKVPLEYSSPLGLLKPHVVFTVEKRNDKVFDGL